MDHGAPFRSLVLAALAAMALVAHAAPASAQDGGHLRADARAGIAIPTADMRNYVDEGPVVGAGIGYSFDERVAVRVDWTAALMRAADRRYFRNRGADVPPRGSETDLHHLTGGLQYELSEPERAAIEVRAHAGAGLTLLFTEETELAVGGSFTQFTVDAGLEIAVPLGRGVRFIGRGDVYVLPFRAGGAPHLLKEVTLPFAGGLAVDL